MKMKLSSMTDGWFCFEGTVPMELANKKWPDRYAAIRAAERAGYICMANGDVVDDTCNDPDAEVNLDSDDDMRRNNAS